MDPPERRRPRLTYAIGDVARPTDLDDRDYEPPSLQSVARLSAGDGCFVLRSGGRFTFAKVLSRAREATGDAPGDVVFELQVDKEGATKTIPLNQCGKYVRLPRQGSNVGGKGPVPRRASREEAPPDPLGPKASPRTVKSSKRRPRPEANVPQSLAASAPGRRPKFERRSSTTNLGSGQQQSGRRTGLRRQASLNLHRSKSDSRDEGPRMRPGLHRQASLPALHRKSNGAPGPKRRPSLDVPDRRMEGLRRSGFGSSFTSGSSGVQSPRSSSDIVEELDELVCDKDNMDTLTTGEGRGSTALVRQGSSLRGSNLRSSILTHVSSSCDMKAELDAVMSETEEASREDARAGDGGVSSPLSSVLTESSEEGGAEEGSSVSPQHGDDDDDGDENSSDSGKEGHPTSGEETGGSFNGDEKDTSPTHSDSSTPPPAPPPVELTSSMRRASLPGNFEDITFDEDNLARAFRSIVARSR